MKIYKNLVYLFKLYINKISMKNWNSYSPKEKVKLMQIFIRNGITDLNQMQEYINSFDINTKKNLNGLDSTVQALNKPTPTTYTTGGKKQSVEMTPSEAVALNKKLDTSQYMLAVGSSPEDPAYLSPGYLEPATVKAFDSQEDYNRYIGDKFGEYVSNSISNAGTKLAPILAGTAAFPFALNLGMAAYANPFVRTALDVAGTIDGVRNFVSDNGVSKTIRLAKEGDTWGAVKSGIGDVFDIASIGDLYTGSKAALKYLRGLMGTSKTRWLDKPTSLPQPPSHASHGIDEISRSTKSFREWNDEAVLKFRNYYGLGKDITDDQIRLALSDRADKISGKVFNSEDFIELPKEKIDAILNSRQIGKASESTVYDGRDVVYKVTHPVSEGNIGAVRAWHQGKNVLGDIGVPTELIGTYTSPRGVSLVLQQEKVKTPFNFWGQLTQPIIDFKLRKRGVTKKNGIYTTKEGITFKDAKSDNVGIDKNGKIVVFDPYGVNPKVGGMGYGKSVLAEDFMHDIDWMNPSPFKKEGGKLNTLENGNEEEQTLSGEVPIFQEKNTVLNAPINFLPQNTIREAYNNKDVVHIIGNWLNNRREQLYNNMQQMYAAGKAPEPFFGLPFYLEDYKNKEVNQEINRQLNRAEQADYEEKLLPIFTYGLYNIKNNKVSLSTVLDEGSYEKDVIKLHEFLHASSHNSPQEYVISQYFKGRKGDKYILNPAEIYARLGTFRKMFDIDPNHTYTLEEVQSLRRQLEEDYGDPYFMDLSKPFNDKIHKLKADYVSRNIPEELKTRWWWKGDDAFKKAIYSNPYYLDEIIKDNKIELPQEIELIEKEKEKAIKKYKKGKSNSEIRTKYFDGLIWMDNFSDEDMLFLLNEVAQNTTNSIKLNYVNPDNIAAYGGKLNTLENGGDKDNSYTPNIFLDPLSLATFNKANDNKLGVPYRDFNSSDYSYYDANKDNMPTEKGGHWTSRNNETGQILKSPNHPTFIKENPIDDLFYSIPKTNSYPDIPMKNLNEKYNIFEDDKANNSKKAHRESLDKFIKNNPTLYGLNTADFVDFFSQLAGLESSYKQDAGKGMIYSGYYGLKDGSDSTEDEQHKKAFKHLAGLFQNSIVKEDILKGLSLGYSPAQILAKYWNQGNRVTQFLWNGVNDTDGVGTKISDYGWNMTADIDYLKYLKDAITDDEVKVKDAKSLNEAIVRVRKPGINYSNREADIIKFNTARNKKFDTKKLKVGDTIYLTPLQKNK